MSRTKKNQDENGIKAPPENENGDSVKENVMTDESVKNEARAAAVDELKEVEINRLSSEIDSLKDLMQRRQADFENYKRHSRKQQEEFKKYALRDIALDIITINDDLIRAVESSAGITDNSETSLRQFSEGVQMISKRIEGALEKYGIVQIDSEGAVFDPNFHEAVEIETVEGIEQDMVAKVYLKGFRIDDIVIRSSKVKVAKPVRIQKPENMKGAPVNGEHSDANPQSDGVNPS